MNRDWVDVFPIEDGDIPAIAMLLGGPFQIFLFSPLPGETIQFDEHLSKGVETTN